MLIFWQKTENIELSKSDWQTHPKTHLTSPAAHAKVWGTNRCVSHAKYQNFATSMWVKRTKAATYGAKSEELLCTDLSARFRRHKKSQLDEIVGRTFFASGGILAQFGRNGFNSHRWLAQNFPPNFSPSKMQWLQSCDELSGNLRNLIL